MLTTKYVALACVSIVFLVGYQPDARGQGTDAQVTSAASQAKTDRSSLEVQLHLLLASNNSAEKGTIPQSIEPAIKQLRPSLPFTNYSVAATFTNRVKGGSMLESKGVLAGEMIFGQGVPNASSYYEFTLSSVNLVGDGPSQSIEIPKFRFVLRLPVLTAVGGVTSQPSIVTSYEPAGITTELSLREATPTMVGTMTTSKPNQLLVLVISVKRTP